MLHALRNVNHIPCLQLDGRLPPFLVPTFAADADQDLSCPVMNMPVVAAARLKGHIGHRQNRGLALSQIHRLQRRKEAVPDKVLGIGAVRLSLREIGLAKRLFLSEIFTEDLCYGLGSSVSLFRSDLFRKDGRNGVDLIILQAHIP